MEQVLCCGHCWQGCPVISVMDYKKIRRVTCFLIFSDTSSQRSWILNISDGMFRRR